MLSEDEEYDESQTGKSSLVVSRLPHLLANPTAVQDADRYVDIENEDGTWLYDVLLCMFRTLRTNRYGALANSWQLVRDISRNRVRLEVGNVGYCIPHEVCHLGD